MKKSVSVLLATSLATSGITGLQNTVLADTANSADSKVERISGTDRYETCVNISKKAYKSSEVAILASGQKIQDALASGGVAAKLKAPLLLTQKDRLPSVVLDELKRLNVKKVILVGGQESISKSLENQLDNMFKVERVSGKDRYETSIKLAEELNKYNKQENIIVNGNTVDALTAGAVAAKLNRSIILTNGVNLPEGANRVVNPTSPNNIIIGGISSINIEGLKGERIGGSDRYETSTKIAEKYYAGKTNKALLANGVNSIDALSAINLVVSENAPVLLTAYDSLDNDVSKFLENNTNKVYVLGGYQSISDDVYKNIEKKLKENKVKDTKKPEIGKPETGKPETGKPETGKPETGKPDTENPDTGKPDTENPDTGKPDSKVEYDEVKVLKDGRYEVEAGGFSKLFSNAENNKLVATVEAGKIKDIAFEYNDTNMDMFKNPFIKNRDSLFEKLKKNNYYLDGKNEESIKELDTIAQELYKLVNENPNTGRINKEGIDKINKEHNIDIVTSATYSTASLYKGSHDLIKKIKDAAETKKVARPKKTDKLNIITREDFAKLDENKTYSDGVYYGDGFGYIGSKPIPLKVTVENGKIRDVEFIKEEVIKVRPNDEYPGLPDDGKTFIKGYDGAISIAKSGGINRLNYFLKTARDTERRVIGQVKKSTTDASVEAYNKVLDDLFSKHEFGSQKLRLENSHLGGNIPHVLESRLNLLTKTYMSEDLGYNYKVDTISGATYTATGTVEAISNALKKADPSVDFTNLTIPAQNGLEPSYRGGTTIDFDQVGFKALMLKKGQINPIEIPFRDFDKYGIKLTYLNHTNGQLVDIKDRLTLTKDSLGYDTKNGLALRLVHDKTNTVKLVKSIQIFDNTKVQARVEKVQVSEADKEDWKDVEGFNSSLDPKSQQLDFSQKLTISEDISQALKGKAIKFRLVTRREDNQKEKIFNLTSDRDMVWPIFDDSGYYALSIDKGEFTSGNEQFKLDQAGINNFRFAFNGIKSGEFRDAVHEFEKKKYSIAEQTISLDKDYANEDQDTIKAIASKKIDDKLIKAAFPSLMSENGKNLLKSANVVLDESQLVNVVRTAASKQQAKLDVKFEFSDGSIYKFKLPVYFEIKKEKKQLQLKFEEALKERKVQLLQSLPESFNAIDEPAKKNLETLINKYGKLDKDKLEENIKTTYGSASNNVFVEKVEIKDSELEKINTSKIGTYEVRATVKLIDSNQEEARGEFDIPFEVVRYQLVGFQPGLNRYSKTTKLEYGPDEHINIARDSSKAATFLGYWLNYSKRLNANGQWDTTEYEKIRVNSLNDLMLFNLEVVKGDKDSYTRDDVVDLSKPAKEILSSEGPTKLYLYNFSKSLSEEQPQKLLIGEFRLSE
ncbi:MAG: cell wall-binding repeat-containing protein [Peptostreptococcus sp.]|uniref:cell wall-binding repeat-containing protein n=1 Tax=Peptostreptococcus sp. TaxID=1262 RepID=UPI001CAABB7B|nr:cell wall-binding repeat-containing protein [Peptostreptococcus sp.]MBF1044645.1 cell wall-binding repeat-containing protein [Peptostreptococcus sp.]